MTDYNRIQTDPKVQTFEVGNSVDKKWIEFIHSTLVIRHSSFVI